MFWKGFPFSENRRASELDYSRSMSCNRRIQDQSMILTAVMQSPQTLEDMDL